MGLRTQYALYRESDGVVIQWGVCSPETVEQQAAGREGIAVVVLGDEYRGVNLAGSVVDVSTGEICITIQPEE